MANTASTVYTLWRHPQLVPLLHTPDFVLQKLRSGAPLMTPGLQHGPPFPAKATKDAVVAVASLEKPTVPIVVGICEIDVAALKQVQGAKGHAVRGEHWDGDEIWAWSSGGKPGRHAPEEIVGWDVSESDGALREGVEHLVMDDHEDDTEEGGVQLEKETEDGKFEPRNEYVEGENAEPYEKVGLEDKELATKGDQAFNISSISRANILSRNRRCLLESLLICCAASPKDSQVRSTSRLELPHPSVAYYLQFRSTISTYLHTSPSSISSNQEDVLEKRYEVHQSLRQAEAPQV